MDRAGPHEHPHRAADPLSGLPADHADRELGHPLVRDEFPDLIAELITLLEGEGEGDLAICAWDLRLIALCDCGDDFCQSIRTAVHPKGQPYGDGHRCVPLLPSEGMLVLAVVDGRIMYVEVLDRAPMRNRRSSL